MKWMYITAVLLFVIGGSMLAMGKADAATQKRVPTKTCISKWVYTHPKSKTAKKCRKQGFYYERGTMLLSTETTPYTYKPYVLVYGPAGHLYVDTTGMYAVPNVR